MIRGEEDDYIEASIVENDSLKCPQPNTSHGRGSRRTRTESSPARWWEGLRSRSVSVEPPRSEEGQFPLLPSYPAEAEARTRAIDKYLAAESQQRKRQLKIILFGDEHEKSLFLKQTRLVETPLSDEERADIRVEARRFIASMCRECLHIIAEYACKAEWINIHPVLGRVKEIVTCETPEDEEIVKSMVRLYCDDELRLVLKQFGHDLEDIERRLLNDRFPHILTCPRTENGNLNSLLKRVFAPDYVPTEHDWFHFDQRRLGRVIQEAAIHRDSHTLQLLQITDGSTQRRKWIHIVVDDAACLLFICDLAVYDQSLPEDETVNRFHEYLLLFDSLVNSRWFTQTPFFVILSNVSAFRKKIPQSPLSKWFPQFGGGSDGDAALKFMEDQFRELAKAEQNVYIQAADIHSAEGVMASIETIENTPLSKVLKELGIPPVERKEYLLTHV
ncbi:guanine nucleotide-binding alpha-3 subunit [Fusarium mundagurra]|uniref:Guanine nucleotide-binding alpha-3 subunit n=1 Tax=Fusarium mundagurra TaxID=1567541 RepID=A0A8H5XYX6_9HYPO|nr:guanine nucleotide-binding alpha-3 subunit [Fusarium mundagurra]